MAKRTYIVAPDNNEQGQISIFFSASLVIFISIIAFVINVGLFVKAKINLQNATDAAAFSGAAVQSRQLTKIAYLNWEMRNVYKEWMYKYYVVGNLNTPGVEDLDKSNPCPNGKCTDFRLAPDLKVLTGVETKDSYNFPATCIHIAGSKTNICKRFAVPGLPEFGGYSIPGTEEASRSFIDALIGSKINDCNERSKLNMLVTSTWAYNVLSNDMDKTLAGRGPAILSDRQGAWPKAVEIAMRIRNLEKVVNAEPLREGVCMGGGNCKTITSVEQESLMGNERVVKAFYSAYRNLGNRTDSEMKNSFILTELAPNAFPKQAADSTSSILIPTSKLYDKRYVDLKLMMVNLAVFYAALIPRSEKDTSGACDISKVALPVPGYPLGFYKNPNVLTYYAVKGEAEFEGMFNPFSVDKIKLTAFAAAKPAGGRIGPMLFVQKNSATVARSDANKFRSVPYISTLNVDGTYNRYLDDEELNDGEYGPGAPLPININSARPFWITNPDSPVGGLSSGGDVQFGIPNLVYDFASVDDQDPNKYSVASARLHTIKTADPSSDLPIGLFNHDQFVKFRGNIQGEISAELLNDQISRVRAATMYEAANYLIPTPNELNSSLSVDSFGSMAGKGVPLETDRTISKYSYEIYAPLYAQGSGQLDVLYGTSSEVLSSVADLMRVQETSMNNYVIALNSAALQTYKNSFEGSKVAEATIPKFKKVALGISDIEIPDVSSKAEFESKIPKDLYIKEFPKSCNSLSGQFWHFYYGHSDLFIDRIKDRDDSCPTSLLTLLEKYYASSAADKNYSSTHYRMDYNLAPTNFAGKIHRIFSAYMPGPFNGISMDGTLVPPPGFPAAKELMRRNFYSTKLVTLDSVQSGGVYNENFKNFVIYSEGNLTGAGGLDGSQDSFVNGLSPDGLNGIKY